MDALAASAGTSAEGFYQAVRLAGEVLALDHEVTFAVEQGVLVVLGLGAPLPLDRLG